MSYLGISSRPSTALPLPIDNQMELEYPDLVIGDHQSSGSIFNPHNKNK
jgi:hypothetical protein